MQQVTQEVTQAIENHLPEMVAKQLKERIARVESLERDVELLKEQNDNLQASVQNAQALNDLQNALKQRRKEVEEREKLVHERELNADKDRLTIRLKAAEDVAEHCKQVALGLVRNIEYRSSAFGAHGQVDHSGMQHTLSDNRDETRTAE